MSKENIFYTRSCLFFLFVFQFFLYFSGHGEAYESLIPKWLSTPLEGLFILFNVYCISCQKKFQAVSIYLILVFLLALLVGSTNRAGQAVDAGPTTEILICFMILFAFNIQNLSPSVIVKYIGVCAILTLGLTIYELSKFDLSSIPSLIIQRSLLWDQKIFYCGTLFWFNTLIIIYSVVYEKKLILPIACWVITCIINMIATKRMFWVETFWMIAIILMYKNITKKKNNIGPIKIIISVLLAGVLVGFVGDYLGLDVSELFGQQQQRFTNDEIEENGFSRFVESETYFKSADFIDIFIGRGLSVPHHGLGGNNVSLHIGINNLIMKFGVFIIIVFLYYLVRWIKSLKSITSGVYDKWQCTCILTFLCQVPFFFLVANYWVLTPATCFFWYCLIRSSWTDNSSLEYESIA